MLDHYCKSITTCLIESAEEFIPIAGRKRRNVAGRIDAAKVLKQQAIFWHKLWVECGSPSTGVAAQIRKNVWSRLKLKSEH